MTPRELVIAVAAWQADNLMHPLTCGTDSRHSSLVPVANDDDTVTLVCPQCDYEQNLTGTTLEQLVVDHWQQIKAGHMLQAPVAKGWFAILPDGNVGLFLGNDCMGGGYDERAAILAAAYNIQQLLDDS